MATAEVEDGCSAPDDSEIHDSVHVVSEPCTVAAEQNITRETVCGV